VSIRGEKLKQIFESKKKQPLTIEEAYRKNYARGNPELECDGKAVTEDKQVTEQNTSLGIDFRGFCKKILLSFVFVIIFMFICYASLVEKQSETLSQRRKTMNKKLPKSDIKPSTDQENPSEAGIL
jgi:hypothetical protein